MYLFNFILNILALIVNLLVCICCFYSLYCSYLNEIKSLKNQKMVNTNQKTNYFICFEISLLLNQSIITFLSVKFNCFCGLLLL